MSTFGIWSTEVWMDIMIRWCVSKCFDDEWLEKYMDIVKYVEWQVGMWIDWPVNPSLWYREFGNMDGYNDTI